MRLAGFQTGSWEELVTLVMTAPRASTKDLPDLDCALPLQGAGIPSLVGELRSLMLATTKQTNKRPALFTR